jgi:hypothetical protein
MRDDRQRFRDLTSDCGDRQDLVGGSCGYNGSGHAPDHRTGLILNQPFPTCLPDRFCAHGFVGAHPRHDQGEGHAAQMAARRSGREGRRTVCRSVPARPDLPPGSLHPCREPRSCDSPLETGHSTDGCLSSASCASVFAALDESLSRVACGLEDGSGSGSAVATSAGAVASGRAASLVSVARMFQRFPKSFRRTIPLAPERHLPASA